MQQEKDVVVGLGEIGKPIYKLLSKSSLTVGYDLNPKLMDGKKFTKYKNVNTRFIHICIPFSDKFIAQVKIICENFSPKGVVIHSTIKPYTTRTLQSILQIPVIYSATRGVHSRMITDLKKYTKFFSIEKTAPNQKWASNTYSKILKKVQIHSKKISSPITLELAKIVVDTSYYGWLINYAQLSNMIAQEHGVDYDEMWSFANEIHKFLGNRPKMFPGFIGGHCVIPNLDLIHNHTLNLIKEINDTYLKKLPKAKSINKKYDKSKKTIL